MIVELNQMVEIICGQSKSLFLGVRCTHPHPFCTWFVVQEAPPPLFTKICIEIFIDRHAEHTNRGLIVG